MYVSIQQYCNYLRHFPLLEHNLIFKSVSHFYHYCPAIYYDSNMIYCHIIKENKFMVVLRWRWCTTHITYTCNGILSIFSFHTVFMLSTNYYVKTIKKENVYATHRFGFHVLFYVLVRFRFIIIIDGPSPSGPTCTFTIRCKMLKI